MTGKNRTAGLIHEVPHLAQLHIVEIVKALGPPQEKQVGAVLREAAGRDRLRDAGDSGGSFHHLIHHCHF